MIELIRPVGRGGRDVAGRLVDRAGVQAGFRSDRRPVQPARRAARPVCSRSALAGPVAADDLAMLPLLLPVLFVVGVVWLIVRASRARRRRPRPRTDLATGSSGSAAAPVAGAAACAHGWRSWNTHRHQRPRRRWPARHPGRLEQPVRQAPGAAPRGPAAGWPLLCSTRTSCGLPLASTSTRSDHRALHAVRGARAPGSAAVARAGRPAARGPAWPARRASRAALAARAAPTGATCAGVDIGVGCIGGTRTGVRAGAWSVSRAGAATAASVAPAGPAARRVFDRRDRHEGRVRAAARGAPPAGASPAAASRH